MAVTIEAIKFDYDRTSATRDALTIRKNAGEDIRIPEWQRQESLAPLTSPAAYAQSQGNNLTIAVQLRRTSTSSDGSVRVSARGGGILGRVGEDTIDFPSQRVLSDFKVFNLVGATIGQTAIGKHEITWDWSLTPDGGGTTSKQTTHQIYTILDLPRAPWGQPGSVFPGFQVPWTDVLDWACAWASGATTPDDAAARITREIHRLGQTKLIFDTQGGADSHFTVKGHRTFKCTKFLKLLNSTTTVKSLVNCTDCACFVSSFTNILGGDLNQSCMGSNFNTNLILEIGLTTPHTTNFRFHEVAWKSPSDASAALFDCCLQVDAVRPSNNVFESPLLPVAIAFGMPGTNYHFHLVPPGVNCSAMPGSSLRRKIDRGIITRRNLVPEVERLLKEEHNFSSWERTQTSDEHIFLWHFSQNRAAVLPSGWTSQDREHFEDDLGTTHVTETIWVTDNKDVVLREFTYECDSLVQAHSLLLTLLDEFQLPGIQRRFNFTIGSEQEGIGDVAFSRPDEPVLLFARANIVTFLQNEGTAFVPLSQFAHDLDAEILSTPGPESGGLVDMNRFRITADKVQVGDDVPIQFIGDALAKKALYKFFSPSGEVYADQDQLVYRVSAPGPQLITVFALQAGQRTARQTMSFVAEPATTDQSSLGFNSDNPNQRSKSMAFNFLRNWSSIRPVGYDPATIRSENYEDPPQLDLTRNGLFDIDSVDPITGEVKGSYKDLTVPGRPVTVSVTGLIKFIGNNTYSVVLSHEDPPRSENKIIYEGLTVALDDTDRGFFIVAGAFRRIVEDRSNLAPGQDEGVWVATKP